MTSFLVYLQAILLDIYLVDCHPKLIFQTDDDAYYVRTNWTQVIRNVNMFLLPKCLIRVANFTDQFRQFRHLRRACY